jgi:transmembrane sensor
MTKNKGNSGHRNARTAAADWWVRVRAGSLSPDEQTAFEAWRENPANAAAFSNISEMCAHLANLPPPRPANRRMFAVRWVWLGFAAPLAAASLALFFYFDELSAVLRSDYSAGTGETKLVTLEDGSQVQLDAQSAIAVHYGASQRRLDLLKGEAWFEAAPDPARPFAVEAAGGTVTALGTAFDVALGKTGALVTVTKHRVSISSGGQNVIVEEGQQSGFGTKSPARAPAAVNAGWITAWRRGKLIVENEPLGEVIAALGRYHHGYVTCLDAAICARRVTGVFGTDDPLESLTEIETSLGLRATSFTRFLVFLHE